jgi:uncharacterized protein YciI
MQFIVLAYDGTDQGALARRLAVRDDHVKLGDKLRDAGKMHLGIALLNDAGKMIGSMLVCDFDSRQELDEWLAIEPYVRGKVWETIEVTPCRIGPSFVKR